MTGILCDAQSLNLSNNQGICGTISQASNYNSSFESYFQQNLLLSKYNTNKNILDNEYIIPVVFHIFHLGEDYGIDNNMYDQKIYEALERLNNDFQNSNGLSTSTIKFLTFNKLTNNYPVIFLIKSWIFIQLLTIFVKKLRNSLNLSSVKTDQKRNQ